MTDKLAVYNGALRELGEPPLTSLTEGRSSRRTLDAFYDQAVNYCLEVGQWTFASRLLMLEASVSVLPSFGYEYFFDKPTDYKNLIGIWSDENMTNPLGFYYDEDKDGWYASTNTIYVKYISDDANYGMNYNKWTSAFLLFSQRYLAYIISPSITNSRAKQTDLLSLVRDAERIAKNVDNRGKPAQRFPTGTWLTSRHAGNINSKLYRKNI